MDKQKAVRKEKEGAFVDLLNQEIKELQDSMKQKQIEEIANDLAKSNAFFDCSEHSIAEYLYNAGYRKIPENAVVLMDEKELEQFKWSKMLDKMGFFKFADNLRKETAEKFAERLKNLEEALLDMVVQFCQMENWGEFRHTFMSAEEQAFDVLDITYGEKVSEVYERFNKKWDRPIDEICKELSEEERWQKSTQRTTPF